MHTSHSYGPNGHAGSVNPTIFLAWLHFAIALTLAICGITHAILPILGVVGMAFFGGVAMLFALLTITRAKA